MKGKTIKVLKTLFLTIAAATFCLALAFSMPKTSSNLSAFADEGTAVTIETVNGFVMNTGADIRVDGDKGGIRYTTNVSANAYSAIANKVENYKSLNFYTLLGNADKGITFDGLTMENAADSNYVVKTKTSKTINGGQDDNYVVTYITSDNTKYGVNLIARGVAEIIDNDDNATYVYAKAAEGEDDNKRSMSELAVSAIQDAEVTADSGLQKYFETQSATSETYAETKAEATTLSLNVPTMVDGESVKAAFIDGNRLDVALADGVTVNNISNVLAENYGDIKTVTLYTDKNNAYNVTVKKISKIINNETEFLKLYDYLDVDNDTTNYILTMNGYVVLGANLDFSSYVARSYNTYGAGGFIKIRRGFGWMTYCSAVQSGASNYKNKLISSGSNNVLESNTLTETGKGVAESNGFIGTFDGQGYTIKGLRIAAMGLFPTVGKAGVIKNVAFADTTLCTDCGTFGSLFAGTLDNVLVDIKATSTTNSSYNNGIFGIARALYVNGTITNTVIYALNSDYFATSTGNDGAIAFINLYSTPSSIRVFIKDGVRVYANYEGSEYNDRVFTSVDAYNNASNKTVINLDEDIWDLTGYEVPVFKTYDGTSIPLKANSTIDDVVIEKANGNAEISLNDVTNVVSVKFKADDSVNFTFESGKLKLGKEALKSLGYGNVPIYVETSEGLIKINATVYSKIIKTTEEFLQLYDYLDVTNDTTNHILTMDGYIVLDTDLDFSTKAADTYNEYKYNTAANATRRGFGWLTYCSEVINSSNIKQYKEVLSNILSGTSFTSFGASIAANGFIGTFDGQGHTIKGLRIAAMGLFPTVGEKGVIKNVAFADTTLSYECFTFGSYFAGTLDNVLVDIKTMVDSGSWGTGGIARAIDVFGTITNTVIYALNTDYFASSGTDSSGNLKINNDGAVALSNVNENTVYPDSIRVFVKDGRKGYYSGTDSNSSKYLFTSIEAYNTAVNGNNVSKINLDETIWNLTDYEVPVFNTYNGTNIAKKTAEAVE